MDKENRSLQIRVFNCICSLFLICTLIYILVVGLEKLAAALLLVSVLSVATPVVFAGGSVLEILVGVLESLLEGVMLVVEGIVNAISSIFS